MPHSVTSPSQVTTTINSSSNDHSMTPPPSTTPLHIRTKNRRKLYLDAHPTYFTNPDLELADPLLYDKCIRAFQTPAERQADGVKKGYSGVLEADLWRGEAKVEAVRAAKNSQSSNSASDLSHISPSAPSSSSRPNLEQEKDVTFIMPPSSVLEDSDPKTKDEGLQRWKYAMILRFLRGEDGDFEYDQVDQSEEWDFIERREREEEWFEDEEPEFVNGKGEGETGVQDF